MKFWLGVRDLLRRLYVGPPLIMVSITAGLLGAFLVPLHYESSAYVVLTAPTSGGTYSQDPEKPNGLVNPLLQFSDGLRTTATILIHSLNTPSAQRELGVVDDGPTTITIDDGRSNPDLLGNNGPFIYLHGDSTSAGEARMAVVRAAKKLRAELERRQRGLDVPRSTFILVLDVVPPSAAQPVLGPKLKIGGVVTVAGLVVGFSIAYLVEYGLRRRREPRGAAPSEPATRTTGAAGDSPEVPTVITVPVAHVPSGVPAEEVLAQINGSRNGSKDMGDIAPRIR